MDQKNSTTDVVEESPVADTASATLPEPSAVAAERDQLTTEKAELQDLFLRRQAEFENYRRS